MATEITEEKFLEYEKIRQEGRYNMFDPKAREVAGLSKEKWFEIIRQYNQLYNKHKGEINGKE